MSAISATYSFKDTSGSLTNPILAGAPIVFAGEICSVYAHRPHCDGYSQ